MLCQMDPRPTSVFAFRSHDFIYIILFGSIGAITVLGGRRFEALWLLLALLLCPRAEGVKVVVWFLEYRSPIVRLVTPGRLLARWAPEAEEGGEAGSVWK